MTDAGPPIRTMIASIDPEWLMRLQDVLDSAGPEIYSTFETAVAELSGDASAVLVVAPTDVETALRYAGAVERRNPAVGIVLVPRELSVDLLRRSMEVGITDAVEADDLAALPDAVANAAARLGQRQAARPLAGSNDRHGDVVLVTSAKGGQGSTTVAVNLALTVVTTGRRVAIVEGDPRYGDVPAALGFLQGRFEPVPAPDVLGDHWLGPYVHRHPSGLMVVVPPRDSTLDALTPELVLEAIEALQGVTDVIVIDSPLWSIERYLLHRWADGVVVVTTDGARDVSHAAMAVHELGVTPAKGRLVISDYVDGRTPRRKDLSATTGLPVAGRIPETDHADQVIDEGEPLVLRHPQGPVATAFGELCDELMALLGH